MWILVVGRSDARERAEGGVAMLRDLGCAVRAVDLWDSFDEVAASKAPPTAVLVEALDELDAGRAALVRIRAAPPLAEVPVVVAVTVSALPRMAPGDGFDDFVLTPYVAPELYARLRRVDWRKSDFSEEERVKLGELVIDLAAHEVHVGARVVELTHQEFALLKFFAQNRGRVYSRDQLLQRVWGVDYYGGSRTVDIHVRRLRMKLGGAAELIETVRGAGYKMRSRSEPA